MWAFSIFHDRHICMDFKVCSFFRWLKSRSTLSTGICIWLHMGLFKNVVYHQNYNVNRNHDDKLLALGGQTWQSQPADQWFNHYVMLFDTSLWLQLTMFVCNQQIVGIKLGSCFVCLFVCFIFQVWWDALWSTDALDISGHICSDLIANAGMMIRIGGTMPKWSISGWLTTIFFFFPGS